MFLKIFDEAKKKHKRQEQRTFKYRMSSLAEPLMKKFENIEFSVLGAFSANSACRYIFN